jgi:hypothetical protein
LPVIYQDTMKLISRFAFLICLSPLLFSCNTEVSEKEFLEKFKAMSDERITFRKNMKALGDSSFAHKRYARNILEEVNADTVFDKVFSPSYAAYNDSIRDEMAMGKSYFEQQFVKNKPMIGDWERTEMNLDRLVERMKSGDISERDGLDSISLVQKTLQGYIHRSDSLVKTSTDRYWKFRNTYAEYLYNMRNLRVLYANELYQMLKARSGKQKK